jgi:hypothetical protein
LVVFVRSALLAVRVPARELPVLIADLNLRRALPALYSGFPREVRR